MKGMNGGVGKAKQILLKWSIIKIFYIMTGKKHDEKGPRPLQMPVKHPLLDCEWRSKIQPNLHRGYTSDVPQNAVPFWFPIKTNFAHDGFSYICKK